MVAHSQLSAVICDTRIKKKKRCRGAELVGKKRNGTGRDVVPVPHRSNEREYEKWHRNGAETGIQQEFYTLKSLGRAGRALLLHTTCSGYKTR